MKLFAAFGVACAMWFVACAIFPPGDPVVAGMIVLPLATAFNYFTLVPLFWEESCHDDVACREVER